jgi:hypothetical protein
MDSVSLSGGRVLVSFDIDGTMEFGDPPGPVSAAMVLALLERGYIVGCASDRAISTQTALWSNYNIDLHFIGGKHHLTGVRDKFEADRYLHVGDTDIDKSYALGAGFEYFSVFEDISPVFS